MTTAEKSAALLQLRQAHVHYGNRRVLHDIALHIARGERVAVLGRSGAGKSTLLSLAFRQLLRQGEAVALIPQHLGLVAGLSIWHNIYMGRLDRYSAAYNLLNLVWRSAERDLEIRALAAELDLEETLEKPAGELSGGQQQRAAVARALYSEAPVILADEPVANLDGPLAERVLALMGERSESLVIALHDTALAQRYCDRVIGVRDGHIALDCAAGELTGEATAALYLDHAPA